MSAPAVRLAVGVLLLGLVVSGCVGMPTSGPVVVAERGLSASTEPGIAISPRGPEPGASATQVVQGFLDAMRATPVKSNVAAQFLSSGIRQSWNPGQETITYSERSQPRGLQNVTVELLDAHHLDDRGAWLGELPAERSMLSFPMRREDGQWRIAEAPDALIVPSWWFESRFTQVSLYFFDPTGEILVPEPVFVPQDGSLASVLLHGLVRGPGPGATGVARSFLPAGVTEGLSVPVSSDGVADVSLTGPAGDLSNETIQLIAAQLAWTLRQDPAVTAIRLSIDGRPVQLASGRTRLGVEESPTVDPSGYQPSPYLFGLRDGVLVTRTSEAFEPVQGAFGTGRHPVGSVALDLAANTAAAVSTDGRSLLVGPVRAEGKVRTRLTGTRLLRPSWDGLGRLWVVDRRARGADLSYLAGGRRHRVVAPGVTRADVRRFLVSRDGSRLVAVVRRPEGDTVVMTRLRSDDRGRVIGAGPVRTLTDQSEGALRVRDVAWLSPTSVLVLHQLGDTAQIRTVSVDGARGGYPAISLTVASRVEALVSSPVPSAPRYAVQESELLGLTTEVPDEPRPAEVTGLTYVG